MNVDEQLQLARQQVHNHVEGVGLHSGAVMVRLFERARRSIGQRVRYRARLVRENCLEIANQSTRVCL